MTGNPTLLSKFEPHTSPSNVTLADGSSSYILGTGTVDLTPSLSLSPVLNLLEFSFNLMTVLRGVLNLCLSLMTFGLDSA